MKLALIFAALVLRAQTPVTNLCPTGCVVMYTSTKQPDGTDFILLTLDPSLVIKTQPKPPVPPATQSTPGVLACVAVPGPAPNVPQLWQPAAQTATFTVSAAPQGAYHVARNGLLLAQGPDYTVAGQVVTLLAPAQPTDIVLIW